MKLTTIEQVQKEVGKLVAPRDLKVIDHVDEHAMHWLSYANFVFIAFGKPGHIQLTAAGGEKGFVTTAGAKHLLIPLETLEDVSIVETDISFGALFLVSGMEESLRVNGKVSRIADELVSLEVEECYLHCAKAFRRSDFWSPGSIRKSGGEVSHHVTQTKFLVLATINRRGQVDVSPKGDPEGFLLQEEDGFICFADRPGNRRIDSFQNILEQPEISVMALVPGCKDMLEIRGTAELYIDDRLLQRFAIQGKTPKLVVKIMPAAIRVRPSEAIARSALWPSKETPKDLLPSEIFKAHIKQSKDNSFQARVARGLVSLPGAMEKGLELDYKNNMY